MTARRMQHMPDLDQQAMSDATLRQETTGRNLATWQSPKNEDAGQPITVIEPKPESFLARMRSLWRYRGFYGFLFKEITMRRARGSLLGVWYLLLRPLMPAAALIFTFGTVTQMDTQSRVPYPVFFLSGYIPFYLFQSSMRYLPRSLTWSRSIMRRTYFPRLLVPLAGFGLPLIEAAVLWVAFIVIVALTWFRGEPFPLQLGWHTLWLIPCLLMSMVFALAFGLVFSIVALFFRDVIFSLRVFTMMALLLTPVAYPVTFVPDTYRWALYLINPMAQVVLVSRWALTGDGHLELGFVLLSFGSVLVALLVGLVFFLRAEAHLGDQM
jgi:lipopolysaccharide transport system permease protein